MSQTLNPSQQQFESQPIQKFVEEIIEILSGEILKENIIQPINKINSHDKRDLFGNVQWEQAQHQGQPPLSHTPTGPTQIFSLLRSSQQGIDAP